MATKNYTNEHPKYKKVSTRERLQKDWKSYSKLSDYFRSAPPIIQINPGKINQIRDDSQTYMKERFMYGDPKISRHKMSEFDRKALEFIKKKFKKKKKKETK